MPDLVAFAHRLHEARNFIELGQLVCTHARDTFDLRECVVSLHAPDGRPLVAVDTLGHDRDASRMAYFDHGWRRDPLLADLRRRHVPIGDDATLALPLLALSRLIGIIRCVARAPYSHDQCLQLAALSLHASVRLAQLGVGASVGTDEVAQLTRRQTDTAGLAAMGHTNAEIASLLDMSANTVKKHLKEVFDRLRLKNRTELATKFARITHRGDAPVGVTRLGEHTITKAR